MEINIIQEIQEATIDKQNLVIKNVSVLGTTSKNRRTYTPKALESGVKLFSESVAFANHVDGKRDVRDMLGTFKAPRIEGNRVKADLHLLEKEKWLMEVAEKMPKSIGFSISATAQLKKSGNEEIVEDLISVKSIDLVDSPATVAGIFEEVQTKMSMTDEEKKEMARLQEENKRLMNENLKVQEEIKKVEEEKAKIEVEKRRLAIREQAEKALPKEAITPEFLKILECVGDVEEAIKDRKTMIEEARKGFHVPQKDNTLPSSTTTNVKFTKEQIKEELKKGGN